MLRSYTGDTSAAGGEAELLLTVVLMTESFLPSHATGSAYLNLAANSHRSCRYY